MATGVVLVMFGAYNANGREIATYDSQPTKFAARELLLRGTTSLNHIVGRTPELLERSGFQLARDGRYRSAYSPVPSIVAAAIAWPLWETGIIDVRAPLAPGLLAKLGSSLLVALAVGLAYLTARRRLGRMRALFIAAAFGLGTGLWSTASQTLWQHETAILGLTLAVFGLTRQGTLSALAVGIGTGLATASRFQLFPMIFIFVAATAWLSGWRAMLMAGAAALLLVVPIAMANSRWFGTVLGAAPMLEALHSTVHGTRRSFAFSWTGVAGLLVSPSRGLFIFSPVVALTAFGLARMMKDEWRRVTLVCLVAAFAEFLLYASYKVWWGGHTYGPRYVLDILPLLIPLGVVAAKSFNGRILKTVAVITLLYSAGVSALGAFRYPNEGWNSSPRDIDRAHQRLWDWSDNQIVRAWHAEASPQNFSLFTRDAVRVPQP